MTNKAWESLYKKASIEGTERNDIITRADPIPKWARTRLLQIFRELNYSESTVRSKISSLNSGLNAIIDKYGEVPARTIDSSIIEDIGNIRPDIRKGTVDAIKGEICRFVFMYTGENPLKNRDVRTLRPCILPTEVREGFKQRLIANGNSVESAKSQLNIVESGLLILSGNIPDFDPMNFGMDEISSMGTFKGGDRKNVRKYELALGRFVWFMTGTDPVRNRKGLFDETHLPKDLLDKIDSSRFRDELTEYLVWNQRRGLKTSSLVSNLYSVIHCLNELDSIRGCDWGLNEVVENDMYALKGTFTNVKEVTAKSTFRYFGFFLRRFGNNVYYDTKILWNNSEFDDNRSWISKEQWRILLEDANVMEKLVLALGGGMGLRLTEISNLRISDICGNTIIIRGKGHGSYGKGSRKHIPAPIRICIDDYLAYRQNLVDEWGNDGEDMLFLSTHNFRGKPLGKNGIKNMIDGLASRNGIRLSAHTLRRFYATSMYEMNYDLDEIRRMMRHDRIETTVKNYLRANPEGERRRSEDLCSSLFS